MSQNETFLCSHCGQRHPAGTTYCPIDGLPIEKTTSTSRLTGWLDNLNISRAWLIAGGAVIGLIFCLAGFVTLTVLGNRSKLPASPTLVIILPSLTPGSSTTAPTINAVTATPSPSTTPTSEPEKWQACTDAVYLSRIHVGDTIQVSNDPPLANRVRKEASLDSEVIGYIDPGEQAVVIDGPRCANQWVWWKVRHRTDGFEGWTAEGDAENFWLIPVSP